MSTQAPPATITPMVVHLGPFGKKMSAAEFFEFCQLNRDLRIERNARGEVTIMTPAGARTGHLNAKVIVQLGLWAEADGTGLFFDSATGFILPNGAERSPDLVWVSRARWDKLTPKQQERFPPLCPDFVGEIRSPSDRLHTLRAKMREYIENGARLGWLIDPLEKRVHVYRPGEKTTRLDDPEMISGDPVLPGFVLGIRKLWS